MSMPVKAYLIGKEDCKKEIRRFDMDLEVSTSFSYLKQKVVKVFGGLRNAPFEMYYKDEDGDMIAFSSDDELTKGLDIMKDDTFHLFIKRKKCKTERKEHKRDSSPDEDPEFSLTASHFSPQRSPHMRGSSHRPQILHEGIYCNGCYGPVAGTRYKCIVCPDYDLCSTCQRKGFHKVHPFMSIFHPTDLF